MAKKKKIIIREVNKQRFKEIKKEEESLEEDVEVEESEGDFVGFISKNGGAPVLQASPVAETPELEKTAETAPSAKPATEQMPLYASDYVEGRTYTEKDYQVERGLIRSTGLINEEQRSEQESMRKIAPRRIQQLQGIGENPQAWKELRDSHDIEREYETVEGKIKEEGKAQFERKRRMVD